MAKNDSTGFQMPTKPLELSADSIESARMSIDVGLSRICELSAILNSVHNIVARSIEWCGEDEGRASQLHCAAVALKKAELLAENADGESNMADISGCLSNLNRILSQANTPAAAPQQRAG